MARFSRFPIVNPSDRDGNTAKPRLRRPGFLPRGDQFELDHAELRSFHEHRPAPT
jgi:hypothetical protein